MRRRRNHKRVGFYNNNLELLLFFNWIEFELLFKNKYVTRKFKVHYALLQEVLSYHAFLYSTFLACIGNSPIFFSINFYYYFFLFWSVLSYKYAVKPSNRSVIFVDCIIFFQLYQMKYNVSKVIFFMSWKAAMYVVVFSKEI